MQLENPLWSWAMSHQSQCCKDWNKHPLQHCEAAQDSLPWLYFPSFRSEHLRQFRRKTIPYFSLKFHFLHLLSLEIYVSGKIIISLKIYAHCAESSVLSIKYDNFCFDILDVCFMWRSIRNLKWLSSRLKLIEGKHYRTIIHCKIHHLNYYLLLLKFMEHFSVETLKV